MNLTSVILPVLLLSTSKNLLAHVKFSLIHEWHYTIVRRIQGANGRKKEGVGLIMPEESHSFLKASLMNSTKYQFFSDKTNYFAVCM